MDLLSFTLYSTFETVGDVTKKSKTAHFKCDKMLSYKMCIEMIQT